MTTENGEQLHQMQELIEENQRLLKENNLLLTKIRRNMVFSMWFRIFWFLFIIGLPFVLYFYVIQPYFDALGSSFGTFQSGLQEIPGWKQFWEALQGDGVQGE